MGPDGSGKTTLAKNIKKKLKNKFEKFQNIHLRPAFLIPKKSIPSKNPHNQVPRSSFLSFIKIIYWFFMYLIFFSKTYFFKSCLTIFDRYADDLLIDNFRYRFNFSKTLTKFFLRFNPQPDLWVVLIGNYNTIYSRKKEIKKSVLKKQLIKYKNFSKSKKNSILINTTSKSQNRQIKKIIRFIEDARK